MDISEDKICSVCSYYKTQRNQFIAPLTLNGAGSSSGRFGAGGGVRSDPPKFDQKWPEMTENGQKHT